MAGRDRNSGKRPTRPAPAGRSERARERPEEPAAAAAPEEEFPDPEVQLPQAEDVGSGRGDSAVHGGQSWRIVLFSAMASVSSNVKGTVKVPR